MKYIKTFENNKSELKKGDIVVLISTDEENKPLYHYFKVGKMYKILHISDDIDDDTLPYYIGDIDEYGSTAWVESYRIRKAEQWELDQNKYNL